MSGPIYHGYTDTSTKAEYHALLGYCENCESFNYPGWNAVTGMMCPRCKETRLVKPYAAKCHLCNAPAYNPCQDSCSLVDIRKES